MPSKNIKVRLSRESINKAISTIREYQKSIEAKQTALMSVLGSRGYDVMVKNISSYPMPYSKGELIDGVRYDNTGNSVVIYNVCNHALFVEFGTGIVGSRSPHPHDTIGYSYDVNGHGDNGWYYRDEDGWHWTKGMPSRPFAHDTFEELRQELPNIVKGVFGND